MRTTSLALALVLVAPVTLVASSGYAGTLLTSVSSQFSELSHRDGFPLPLFGLQFYEDSYRGEGAIVGWSIDADDIGIPRFVEVLDREVWPWGILNYHVYSGTQLLIESPSFRKPSGGRAIIPITGAELWNDGDYSTVTGVDYSVDAHADFPLTTQIVGYELIVNEYEELPLLTPGTSSRFTFAFTLNIYGAVPEPSSLVLALCMLPVAMIRCRSSRA